LRANATAVASERSEVRDPFTTSISGMRGRD
jgi:hypothetical protein